ncbi:MAG: hypothetical protein OEW45_10935, partial [Deltaproteobacteria bacterium]|nr:hypothetical protein [Deltaproteobacteria bacterium]
MGIRGFTGLFSILAFSFLLAPTIATLAAGTDFEKLHRDLRWKVEREAYEPPGKGALELHKDWMRRKAADRDRARMLAAQAQNEGNPYWAEQFLEIAELAQGFANYNVRCAVGYYVYTTDSWRDAVEKSKEPGWSLYQYVMSLGLDADIVRKVVQCNMRFAIGYVESNHQDVYCLYRGRVSGWGRTLDADGIVRLPTLDADVLCLSRSAFHTDCEGYPHADPDEGLGWVEEIREVCELFRLFEKSEATDLMNQYLMDAYCWLIDKPAGAYPETSQSSLHRYRSLRWHYKLAEKHQLEKSKQFLNGLKGTVFGVVEIDEGGVLRPANGAVVEIIDHDETFSAKTDAKGRYEIKDAPISSRCSPVFISATYRGKTVESRYEGILDEPKPDERVEKNLVVPGGEWQWNGSLKVSLNEHFQCSKRDKGAEEVTREFFERNAMVTFRLKKLDLEESPAARIADDLPDLRLSGTVQARAYYNNNSNTPESRRKDRMVGLGRENLRPADVQISISRDIESMQKKIEAIAKRGSAGDLKALEEMNKLLMGSPEGGTAVAVVVTIQKGEPWKLKMHRHVEEKQEG